MIQMMQIEFSNVDDVVEIVESRFQNARVEMIESMRESLIHELQNVELKFDFDELHNVIENNLRATIAHHYARSLTQNNENEFANIVAIVDEHTFHRFAIVELNVETMHARIITFIIVNDNLIIELLSNENDS